MHYQVSDSRRNDSEGLQRHNRWRWTLPAGYALLLILLAAAAPRTIPGDGGEYLAYSLAFARGTGPALSASDLRDVQQEIARIDPMLAVWEVQTPAHRAPDGRFDFVHFWLYSAAAAPFVAVARLIGVDPRIGFIALNVLLLAAGLAVAGRRIGTLAALMLFAGPIVWWSDKAHVEVWLFSLMTMALVLWRDRPQAAMIAAALAATQAPPFAIFVPLLAIAALVDRPDRRRALPFWAGVAAALMIAALPALYYLARFGTPSLLASATRPHWPSWTELTTVLFDLNLGLLPNWPLLALAVAVSLLVALRAGPRRLLRPDVLVALCGGVVLLAAFTQIGNFTHGGTPGILRYAVWIVPLTIPFLRAGLDLPASRAIIIAIALISVPLTLVHYRPAQQEFAHRPTAIALWTWRLVPSWSDPLADVFAVSLGRGSTTLPIATPGCDKVLLIGRGEAQGMWPRPCPPSPIPDECRRPGTLCYANRSGRSYTFRSLEQEAGWLKYDPASVWPKRGEQGVRGTMVTVDWWSMELAQDGDHDVPVSGRDVVIEHQFQADGRVLVVLRNPGASAAVHVRSSAASRALLLDAEHGRTVFVRTLEAGDSLRTVDIPSDVRLGVLALW